MVQALNLALRQEMEKDDRVIVLGQDVGVDGGVFRVTEGLIEKFGPERVVTPPSRNPPSSGRPSAWPFMGCGRYAKSSFRNSATSIFIRSKATPPACATVRRAATRFPCAPHPYGGGVRALEHHSDSVKRSGLTWPG